MLNLILSILICAILYVVYRLSALENEVRYLASSNEWDEPPLVLPSDELHFPEEALPDFTNAAPVTLPSPIPLFRTRATPPHEPPQPSAHLLQPPDARTVQEHSSASARAAAQVLDVDLSEAEEAEEAEEEEVEAEEEEQRLVLDDDEEDEEEEIPPPPPSPPPKPVKKPVRRTRRE